MLVRGGGRIGLLLALGADARVTQVADERYLLGEGSEERNNSSGQGVSRLADCGADGSIFKLRANNHNMGGGEVGVKDAEV